MDYELCKKLKDAGFPQSANWNADAHKTPNSVFLQVQKDGFYIPNLTELIEACGDDFWNLKLLAGLWICEGARVEEITNCKTPEEAVAKLWLELRRIKKK